MAITVEKRHRVLRLFLVIANILAIVILLLGLIMGAIALGQPSDVHNWRGVVIIIFALFAAVIVWMWTVVVKLLLGIEEEARKANILIKRRESED